MKKEDDIIFDFKKLKNRIREFYDRQADFAKDLGIEASTLSKKLNNKLQFTSKEIVKTCKLLHIEFKYADEYFFTLKVQETEL